MDGGGAVVVMVHGRGSTHRKMLPLAEPLLRAGHPVFPFDVRHHGDSPPADFVTVRQFRDDIVTACRCAVPTPELHSRLLAFIESIPS